MEWIEYAFKGGIIKVRAVERQIAGNNVWIPELNINGAVITPVALGNFQKRFFDNAEKAIEYAKMAGETTLAGGAQGKIPEEIL